MDLKTYFDRVVVITLKRTPQRLESFRERMRACQWPFKEAETVYGVDGLLCPPPPWWNAGPGAHGAARSHLRVIEDALNDESIQRLLVLEDDAEPIEGFAEKVIPFLEALPDGTEICYMGGQITHKPQNPDRINDLVMRPESVNRLHAYFLNRSGMAKVYRHLNRWNWHRGEKDAEGKWRGASHIDHHIETLSAARQIATYCPTEWLVNQAPGFSEIVNRHLPDRSFAATPKPPTVIAVLGPYRGGTSAVAGAMHNMGIIMGHKFFGGGQSASPRGCFEAEMLYKLCMACYNEPDFREVASRFQRVDMLRKWAAGRNRDGSVIGAKHPKLCLMVPEMCEAWPNCKFIVCHRDIKHSIASLRKLGWWAKVSPPETLIPRLINARDAALKNVPADRQFHIEYEQLLADPETTLKAVATFAGVEPTPAHYRKATEFLDATMNHRGNGKQCNGETCNCETPCETCTCR